MRRGSLRIYIGAAPGVGKTFAMLGEGCRRKARGTDVVVGFVETHGRPATAEQIRDLEVVPRRKVEYRSTTWEEMDVEAILERAPAVVLVDELAHTNVPGSPRDKRWEDVDLLLDAGISVVSTVNIQHLESLNDVVETITGVKQHETVPDAVVRRADQVELVDMAPEALRRRLAHGNVYPAERVDPALANYFRLGNLGALRELALMWVADRVDEALQGYRERHGISRRWETRERVMVALTGAPGGDRVIRRAARIAERTRAELIGVHVRTDVGLAGHGVELLAEHRRLLADLGGRYHEVAAAAVETALVEAARAQNATQLVLGATRRTRLAELTRGSVINAVIRAAPDLDVHVIGRDDEQPRARALPAAPRLGDLAAVSRRRQLSGLALGAAVLALLTVVVAAIDQRLDLSSILLLYLLLVVATSVVGGVWAAMATAVGAFLLVNWFFTPPIHALTISRPANVFALCVFLVVAAVTSGYVALAARRATTAARASAEVETFSEFAGSTTPGVLIERLRTALDLTGVSLLKGEGAGWELVAGAGEELPTSPDGGFAVQLSGGEMLVLGGGTVDLADRRVIRLFTAELAEALERARLHVEASQSAALAAGNELRTALLASVSHDLRTPLAAVKASVTSLLSDDVAWSPDEAREFLQTIDGETDRLATIVANLLDMSRLQAGALHVQLEPTGYDEVVPAALASIGNRADGVRVDVPETLPRVAADPALLERAIANLLANAISFAPDGVPVRVEAAAVQDRVDLQVIDRGPGIPEGERDRVFEPFQQLDASASRGGVGLGLAVARGFVSAMGGALEAEETPGGGLTMVLRMAAAS